MGERTSESYRWERLETNAKGRHRRTDAPRPRFEQSEIRVADLIRREPANPPPTFGVRTPLIAAANFATSSGQSVRKRIKIIERHREPLGSMPIVQPLFQRLIADVSCRMIDERGQVAKRSATESSESGRVMGNVPSEISFEWIYFPPFLFAVVLGYAATFGITRALNATGLSKYFWHSGLVFIAIWVTTTSWIGLLFLPP